MTAQGIDATALSTHVEALIERFTRLREVLDTEALALTARDLDGLAAATASKERLATEVEGHKQHLEALLAGKTLRDVVQSADTGARFALERLLETLREVAASCRHQNAVNGKVIHRSRQSFAELARILSGTDADPRYTAHGRKRPASDGHSLALA